jgi:hypothetical protein
MDFDYKKKHNSKKHHDLLKQRKAIRYKVVGAPKNLFDTAARKVTVVSTKQTAESAKQRLRTKKIRTV